MVYQRIYHGSHHANHGISNGVYILIHHGIYPNHLQDDLLLIYLSQDPSLQHLPGPLSRAVLVAAATPLQGLNCSLP
jgi:hypothetical protein